MVDAPVQTWADNAKEIVTSVAHWMLVECVAARSRWNSLTDGDGLVLRGTEMASEIATHRGIPLGTVTLSPGELLAAMQDVAKASMAPTHPLPMVPVAEVAPEGPVTDTQPPAVVPVEDESGHAHP